MESIGLMEGWSLSDREDESDELEFDAHDGERRVQVEVELDDAAIEIDRLHRRRLAAALSGASATAPDEGGAGRCFPTMPAAISHAKALMPACVANPAR